MQNNKEALSEVVSSLWYCWYILLVFAAKEADRTDIPP